jgi:hypothetical protein
MMIKTILFLVFLLKHTFAFSCSFHISTVDLFFVQGSSALIEKSRPALETFVVKAEAFHYIDFVLITTYTGHELVSSERLEKLAAERSQLVKAAVSNLKIFNDRVFLEHIPASKNRGLSPQPHENFKVEVAVNGWRKLPIAGRWCGIACPCFEKD